MIIIGRFLDLTGKKIGRLTVIKRVENNSRRQSQWLCKCDCGNEVIIVGSSLVNERTKSCGCLRIEKFIEHNKKYNTYDLTNEYGVGYTSNTNKPFYFDLEDYDLIKDYCWRENDKGYILTYIDGKQIRMHKLFIESDFVDHINHNLSDNRKCNLRPTTNSQNQMNAKLRINNTSGVTGVHWSTKRKKWFATITINQKRIQLGGFIKFDDAVKARKEAEEKYFGEFSYDNSMKVSI